MAESAYEKLIDLCQSGVLNPMDVLENVLTNYMSTDDANDFAESEYDLHYDEDDEDEEDYEDLEEDDMCDDIEEEED